jgi:hypothetical protein
MAKKPKRAANPPQATPATTIARASLVTTDGTATFYVNNVEIGHSAYDFSVTCAKLPVKFPPAEMARIAETGEAVLEAVVQILLPTSLIPGLIKALTIQKEMYERQFGEIRDPSGDLPMRKSRNDH